MKNKYLLIIAFIVFYSSSIFSKGPNYIISEESDFEKAKLNQFTGEINYNQNLYLFLDFGKKTTGKKLKPTSMYSIEYYSIQLRIAKETIKCHARVDEFKEKTYVRFPIIIQPEIIREIYQQVEDKMDIYEAFGYYKYASYFYKILKDNSNKELEFSVYTTSIKDMPIRFIIGTFKINCTEADYNNLIKRRKLFVEEIFSHQYELPIMSEFKDPALMDELWTLYNAKTKLNEEVVMKYFWSSGWEKWGDGYSASTHKSIRTYYVYKEEGKCFCKRLDFRINFTPGVGYDKNPVVERFFENGIMFDCSKMETIRKR